MPTELKAIPTGLKPQHLIYLDQLRESGATNMWGATPFLAKAFSMSHAEAAPILLYWMRTFSERHPPASIPNEH